MATASVPRMMAAPFTRFFRRRSMPLPTPGLQVSASGLLTPLILAVTAALQRLDLSRDPRKTIAKARKAKVTVPEYFQYAGMASIWIYALWNISFPMKLLIPLGWLTIVLIPFTSQLFWPATPVLTWVLLFFSARYIPTNSRPGIHVALLPALESLMYGANISDLQTRFTHPVLDVMAWLSYGVLHFALPVIVALLLWVFGPKYSAQFWGKAFGWMNIIGVMTQIALPCAAPWYEIIHGLTPADYSMPGSPGGLLRIDRVFHSNGYTNTFGNAPLVFGAFPSLHSGCAIMEALFLSHFFPAYAPLYWCYTGILWWATMYLSHHYLIDLAGGACLSVLVFYIALPNQFKDPDGLNWPTGAADNYEMANATRDEVDFDEEIRKLEEEGGAMHDEEGDIGLPEGSGKGRNKRTVSWGETSVLGENGQRQ